MQINLNLKTLKALAKHCAGKNDIRAQLNGVAVQHRPDGRYLVATTGTIAGIVRYECGEDDARDVPDFIIPRDFLDDIKLRRTDAENHVFEIDAGAHGVAQISIPALGRTCLAVDATFPDWRRIVPAAVPGALPGQFDPVLLAALDACYRACTGATYAGVLVHTGPESCGIYHGGNFVGVIGALRKRDESLPDWTPNQPAPAPEPPADDPQMPESICDDGTIAVPNPDAPA